MNLTAPLYILGGSALVAGTMVVGVFAWQQATGADTTPSPPSTTTILATQDRPDLWAKQDRLVRQAAMVRMARPARKVSKDCRVRLVLKGLLAWMVLMVPLALLVGKAIRVSGETAARQELQALRARQGPQVCPECRALRESQDRRDPWAQWGHPAPPDRKGMWE